MAEVTCEMAPPPQLDDAQIPATAGPAPLEVATIFIVDDEPMVGEVVDAVLKMAGYQTRLFQDPVSALRAFAEAHPRPRLLLTDFAMGELNGMELISRCLRAEPRLRTILFSGHVDETILKQYAVQPDCFLQKPLPPKALADTVHALLAS
jgi:DNA-binding NtrC family response regulator